MRFRGTPVANCPGVRPLLKKAFGFGIAIVMPFAMGSAFLTLRPTSTAAAIETTAPAPGPESNVADDDDQADVDIQGNPVTDAVAKYKFDAGGSLYEVHSPQTELPRLAPPKS
jgi:hypothetical protein